MASAPTLNGSVNHRTALSKATATPTSKSKPKLPKGKGVAVTTPIHVAPVIPYAINKLPVWTLDTAQDPGQRSPAYSQSTSRGYDIEAMRLNQARREAAMAYANGVLSTGPDPSQDTKMPFFVTGVGIDWALAGTTAQSRETRDWYPHNFIQPSFIIQGVSLSQYDYGEMVEFIHKAQHDALNGGGLVQLNVYPSPGGLSGNRPKKVKGTPARGVHTRSKIIGTDDFPNQIIRGHHEPITCQGYVSGMQRKHQKGVFSPTWQFSFTVGVMLEGPYKEQLRNLQRQKNWTELLKVTSGLFQSAFYAQEDQATLDWVRRESIHIFDVTETAVTTTNVSGAGSGSSPSAAGLTVKGSPATAHNRHAAGILLASAAAHNAPRVARVAVIISGIWESGLGVDNGWDSSNPTYGGLLAGNHGYFGSLGSADSDAVASAEVEFFFLGGRGYNSAINHASQYPNAVNLAQYVEGCGNQYRQENGYPGDTAAIAEATAWVDSKAV